MSYINNIYLTWQLNRVLQFFFFLWRFDCVLHGVVSLSHNKMLYFAAVSEIERKVDLCQSYTEVVFM